MGLYLLSVAVGNQLTVQVNVFIKAQKEEGVNYLAGANYYWFFTGLMAVTAVVYVAFAQFYRGQTYIQGAEKQHDSADAKTD